MTMTDRLANKLLSSACLASSMTPGRRALASVLAVVGLGGGRGLGEDAEAKADCVVGCVLCWNCGSCCCCCWEPKAGEGDDAKLGTGGGGDEN